MNLFILEVFRIGLEMNLDGCCECEDADVGGRWEVGGGGRGALRKWVERLQRAAAERIFELPHVVGKVSNRLKYIT